MSKRRFLLFVLAITLALLPGRSYAEGGDAIDVVDCGEFNNSNNSWQFGKYAWVEFIVETRRSVNICPYAVGVDAWVVGISGSAANSWDLFTASVRRQVPVFSYRIWQTNGKHWRILAGFWYDNGATASHANVRPPQQAADPAYQCLSMGGEWTGTRCILPNCPLIVDTARDGYRLTGVDEGVRFDLDADGTRERVAWTAADSDEAFLALDRNGNGQIDDGSELFGNNTPAYADRSEPTAANGFEALEFAQGPSYGASELDAAVDGRDAIFSRLLLWRDVNHNGVSEPEELESAAASGLIAVGTAYKTSGKKDRHGNEFRQRAKASWTDGEAYVYDVWLKARS